MQSSKNGRQSFEVVSSWTASFDDPIILKVGDELTLSGRADNWHGHTWVWAKATDDKEGWIPDTLATIKAGITTASTDFSAIELSCISGEILTGIKETHGWVWCLNEKGFAGWVPSRNLKLK